MTQWWSINNKSLVIRCNTISYVIYFFFYFFRGGGGGGEVVEGCIPVFQIPVWYSMLLERPAVCGITKSVTVPTATSSHVHWRLSQRKQRTQEKQQQQSLKFKFFLFFLLSVHERLNIHESTKSTQISTQTLKMYVTMLKKQLHTSYIPNQQQPNGAKAAVLQSHRVGWTCS